MATGSYLSINTLNVNGFKQKTKTGGTDPKTRPLYMLSTRDYLEPRDTYRLKVRGWKKIFHENGDQKKAGVAILISNKIDFEIKAEKRDKEGHYIMIKGSIQGEDITIINIYAPNTGGL